MPCAFGVALLGAALVGTWVVTAGQGTSPKTCTLPSPPEHTRYVKTQKDCVVGKVLSGASDPAQTCTVQCLPGFTQDTEAGTYEVGCSCHQMPCTVTLPTPVCRPCDIGTYNPTGGSPSCSACPGAPGSTTAAVGSADITDCVCDKGYVGVIKTAADSCEACTPGQYKNKISSADGNPRECTKCPCAALTPSTCTTLVTAPTQITDCVCKAGYSGTISTPSDKCTECSAGTYKSEAGTQLCQTCPANSNTGTATKSTSVGACKCLAGYFGTIKTTSDICTACPQGQYHSNPSEHELKDTGSCIACPTGSTTATSASTLLSDCLCNRGTFGTVQAGLPSPCSECPADTFKSTLGPGACTHCPEGTKTDSTKATDGAMCRSPLSNTDMLLISGAFSFIAVGLYAAYRTYARGNVQSHEGRGNRNAQHEGLLAKRDPQTGEYIIGGHRYRRSEPDIGATISDSISEIRASLAGTNGAHIESIVSRLQDIEHAMVGSSLVEQNESLGCQPQPEIEAEIESQQSK